MDTLSLTDRQRALAIAGVVVATLVTGVLDYYVPTVQLRPLSYVFVIALTALVGYRWGIIYGILAAFFFTAIETYTGMRFASTSLIWNALLAAIALVAAVGLVEVIRGRIAAEQKTAAELRVAQSQLANLSRMQAAEMALRSSERRYKTVGESMPYGVWQTNASGDELLFISESYRHLLGLTQEEIVSGGWARCVPQEDREKFLKAWQARESGKIFEGEYRVHGRDGRVRWIWSRGVAVIDDDGTITGWAGFNLDITRRKRSEQQFAFLSELGRNLASSLEPAIVFERTAALFVPRFADWCTIDASSEAGEIERVLLVHRDPDITSAAKSLLGSPEEAALFGFRTAEAMATGKPLLLQLPKGMAKTQAQIDLLKQIGLGSLICVPLIARDRIVGALTLVSASHNAYDEEDVNFVSIAARRVALAHDNARLYAREHRVADAFQRASLPTTLPDVPGVAISAHYEPGASEAEIGGDWYDAFQLNDGRLALCIGDVAGKGLPAASIMSTLRLYIRASALEELPPSAVLARASQLLLNDRQPMATAIFGIFDPEELTFTCSIAGHPPPLVMSAGGEITSARPVAPPLGALAATVFPEQTLMVPPGSLLVLYTDGLIENERGARDSEGDLIAAVRKALHGEWSNRARLIAQTLIEGAPKDDVAVLTIAPAQKPLLEVDLTLPAAPQSSRLFRQALRRFYLAAGLDYERIDLLQVAVGEAIMNSIEHAYGVRDGNVRVTAHLKDEKVVIDVSDRGRWRPAHHDGGGYGMRVLKGLAEQVDVNRTDGGTTVRFTQSVGRAIS